jgi:hypothetical protein
MSSATEQKHWATEFCKVYDSIPESEGFNELDADKQIEGLLEIVSILGDRVAEQDQLILRLTKLIKNQQDSELTEDEYKPSELHETTQNMYL